MQFKTETAYIVGTTDYLDKVFTEIPNNAFINKGRCGIGGTTLELRNLNRCSIIVAPTVGILKDKVKSHPDLFIVYAEVTFEQVKNQLSIGRTAQKIMTTPEGIKKIMTAAQQLGMLAGLYSKWFLLLDECHSFASEDYRKDILRPFDYFWEFQNKAIISATPYFFSDERFYTLDYHKIEFTDKLGTITLVDCKSVQATLNYIIMESAYQKGTLHIFLNSVTEIALAARRAGLADFNIFCANDKDKKNMEKLGDLQQHYVEQPDKDNFKKVNFYTSRYFEGWDMFDEDATIVLVTDIHNPHTKVSISMKLKQAAGRLRNTPTQIIHITNHHNNNNQPKSHQSFNEEYYVEAAYLLEQHGRYIDNCKAIDKKPDIDTRLDKYADLQYKTHVATLNKMKIDQQINQAYSHEMYNNITLIKQEWENGYYDVQVFKSDLLLEPKSSMKRKSKSTQLREDYIAIVNESKQTGNLVYSLGTSAVDKIKSTNPLAYQAAQLIDERAMEAMKYNVKKVQAEVIAASNVRKEVKLLQMLNQEFKQGVSYSNAHITRILQDIYTRLDLRDPKTGEIIKASATHLGTKGWFDIAKCKVPDEYGTYTIHGYLIQRPQFNSRVAA